MKLCTIKQRSCGCRVVSDPRCFPGWVWGVKKYQKLGRSLRSVWLAKGRSPTPTLISPTWLPWGNVPPPQNPSGRFTRVGFESAASNSVTPSPTLMSKEVEFCVCVRGVQMKCQLQYQWPASRRDLRTKVASVSKSNGPARPLQPSASGWIIEPSCLFCKVYGSSTRHSVRPMQGPRGRDNSHHSKSKRWTGLEHDRHHDYVVVPQHRQVASSNTDLHDDLGIATILLSLVW